MDEISVNEPGEKKNITVELTAEQWDKITEFARNEGYRLPRAYAIVMSAGIKSLGF